MPVTTYGEIIPETSTYLYDSGDLFAEDVEQHMAVLPELAASTTEVTINDINVLRHVRDAMADSQDKQEEQADAKGRGCIESYAVGDQVLLNAKNLPTNVVSAVFKTKLRPRFIGPFTVVAKKGLAYTLNLPRKLRTHPVFYVGLLKPYRAGPVCGRLGGAGAEAGGLAAYCCILSRMSSWPSRREWLC